jgi:Ca2+-binding RTX toxin-like protein
LGRIVFILTVAVVTASVLLTMGLPALAQTPISMVDCVIGGPCIGTSGDDTITGSDATDEIYGLEGNDTIDPGNDSVVDSIVCGPGFDTVDQMPRGVDDTQDAIQYDATEFDVIADDCEVSAL